MLRHLLKFIIIFVVVQCVINIEAQQQGGNVYRREVNRYSRRNKLNQSPAEKLASVQIADVKKDDFANIKTGASNEVKVKQENEESINVDNILDSEKSSIVTKPRRRLPYRRNKLEPQKDDTNETTLRNDVPVSTSESSTVTDETTTITTAKPKYNPRERIVNRFSRKGKFETRGQLPPGVVPIVDMESYVFSHRGRFHYSYEGGDGTKVYEKGESKKSEDNTKSQSVVGGYSYKSKDGENISVQYVADENGFRAVGDHLPTPPPIPPEIAQALFILATKAPDIEDIYYNNH